MLDTYDTHTTTLSAIAMASTMPPYPRFGATRENQHTPRNTILRPGISLNYIKKQEYYYLNEIIIITLNYKYR